MTYIQHEAEIRSVIGTPPAAINLKKLRALEKHSKRYLEMSHLIALTAQSIPTRIGLVATQQSGLEIVSDTKIVLTLTTNNSLGTSVNNEPCGLYVLICGFEESLRINGTISVTSKDDVSIIELNIKELYFHCAKSIKRSRLWAPVSYPASVDVPIQCVEFSSDIIRNFIKQSPFLLLATENSKGDADLSPRGDPAGFVRVLDEQTVLIPERPGNRIADSLTNIIANSSIAIILFIPGVTQALILTGVGKITSSQVTLAGSAVKNKTPKLGIELTVESTFLGTHTTLADLDLWDGENHIDRSEFPSLGGIISDQMQTIGKLPGSGSAVGRVLGKVVGVASELAIKQDYKKNLY